MKNLTTCVSRIYILLAFFAPTNLYCQGIEDPYNASTNSPDSIKDFLLVWHDEFNVDGKPDTAFWDYEVGFIRNEELQWYQPDNAICKDGSLVITGKREQIENLNFDPQSENWRRNRKFAEYTSSCLKTRDLMHWQYGILIVRARIDTTKGSWPAIWTLGVKNRWPACGEIDVMEFYRVEDEPTMLGNIAWASEEPWTPVWDTRTLPLSHFLDKDPEWPKKFHVWRMEWNQERIQIYLDDELINTTFLKTAVNADGSRPFHQPHYLLLNLAIGSNGGNPDLSDFPITYEVDFVRIYQEVEEN